MVRVFSISKHHYMNTKKYLVSYACKYNPSACTGNFTVEADCYVRACVLARKHLIETGGTEGIEYSVQLKK